MPPSWERCVTGTVELTETGAARQSTDPGTPAQLDGGDRIFRLRRRLIVLGILAVLVPLLVSLTALIGLHRVDRANDRLRIGAGLRRLHHGAHRGVG